MRIDICGYCGKEFVQKDERPRKHGRTFCNHTCNYEWIKATPRDSTPLFWEKVNKESGYIATNMTTQCWLWTGSKDPRGYGYVRIRDKGLRVHRYSWTLHNGEIPNRLYVLHKCDIRNCVRPDHLFLGTQQDNMDDMYAKGRNNHRRAFADSNPCAKLTWEKVREIRALYASGMKQVRISEIIGISKGVVNSVCNNKSWVE